MPYADPESYNFMDVPLFFIPASLRPGGRNALDWVAGLHRNTHSRGEKETLNIKGVPF